MNSISEYKCHFIQRTLSVGIDVFFSVIFQIWEANVHLSGVDFRKNYFLGVQGCPDPPKYIRVLQTFQF